MSLYLPINVYTVGVILTLILWIWYWRVGATQHGDYDFGPAIFGFIVLCCTVVFWFAVLLARCL